MTRVVVVVVDMEKGEVVTHNAKMYKLNRLRVEWSGVGKLRVSRKSWRADEWVFSTGCLRDSVSMC